MWLLISTCLHRWAPLCFIISMQLLFLLHPCSHYVLRARGWGLLCDRAGYKRLMMLILVLALPLGANNCQYRVSTHFLLMFLLLWRGGTSTHVRGGSLPGYQKAICIIEGMWRLLTFAHHLWLNVERISCCCPYVVLGHGYIFGYSRDAFLLLLQARCAWGRGRRWYNDAGIMTASPHMPSTSCDDLVRELISLRVCIVNNCLLSSRSGDATQGLLPLSIGMFLLESACWGGIYVLLVNNNVSIDICAI